MATSREELMRAIAHEYYDMNGTYVHTLPLPPSALQFSQLVHKSRPVIIKGFNVPAFDLWADDYLVRKMGGRIFSVAVTPNGRADAIAEAPDGTAYFVEPCTERMAMEELLHNLESEDPSQEVRYLQSQNGNLYSGGSLDNTSVSEASEFHPLIKDVPRDVAWASEALGRAPDAVNLWIGNSQSVTSIHNDPYENIYTVIRGAKHFTLLPPTDSWCLRELEYPHATYTRSLTSSAFEILPSDPSIAPSVRWSSISDPHIPGNLPPSVHPIHITLLPGDTLYLPVGWWHHVRQAKGVTIALNWWYDCEMEGISWTWLNFLRGRTNVEEKGEES